MKSFIDLLGRIKGGYALPKHLRYKLHNDWPFWPLTKVPRELNAFGPRSKRRPFNWRRFPILLIGYNVPRWMDAYDKEVKVCDAENRWVFLRKYPDCGPSPLQKFGGFSWQITWPLHFALSLADDEGNCKFLFRIGCRWDSLDVYYNIGPYAGLEWN